MGPRLSRAHNLIARFDLESVVFNKSVAKTAFGDGALVTGTFVAKVDSTRCAGRVQCGIRQDFGLPERCLWWLSVPN